MASTVIAGKPSNTVGEKDSTLVLRGSSVKILWGNKFIDLIKNGKLNVELDKILKTVNSIDDAKKDGIYLVEDSIWVVIGGSKIQLTGTNSTVYVSFAELLETTAEEKNNALKNIGFYYNTLEEALAQGLSSGIIYVLGDNKLYTVINGQFSEYFVLHPILEEEKVEETLLKMLYIEEYSLFVDGDEYLRCENNLISVIKQLITEQGIYSLGASDNYGYKLYIKDGKSILEVDKIIERDPKYLNVNLPYTLYSHHNNIVERVDSSESNVICNLLEENKYLKGDYVYIYTYCLIEDIYKNGTLTFNLSIPLDKEIEIIVNDSTIKIPKNVTTYSVSRIPENPDVSYSKIQKVLREYKILESEKQQVTIEIPSLEREMFLLNCTYLYDSRHPYIEILDNNLKLLDRSKEILNKETGEKEPDNTIHSNIGIVKEDKIESLKISEEIEIEDYIRPDVGIYSDNFMGLNSLLFNPTFKVAGKRDKITEHLKYPKYDNKIELPENKLLIDKKFNLTVPDIEWIKRMVDLWIPVGTIVMWNGALDPPPGWAICNGENGTPDLIDRFIKGGTECVVVNPEGIDEENTVLIEEKNLPKHSHPHKPHTHEMTELSGSTDEVTGLVSTLKWNDYLWNLQVSRRDVIESVTSEGITSKICKVVDSVSASKQGGSAVGADHSHTVTIDGGEIIEATSEEVEKIWDNKRLKIEPRSHKLIFIMKIKTFVDYFEELT